MRSLLTLAVLALALPAAAGSDASFAAALAEIRALTARPLAVNRTVQRAVVAQAAASQAIIAQASAPRADDLVTRFPQLRECEKTAAGATTGYRPWELWLLTDVAAYYYHEDCDICAALDSCDMRTGVMTEYKTAHSISCSEGAPLRAGRTVLYDVCR